MRRWLGFDGFCRLRAFLQLLPAKGELSALTRRDAERLVRSSHGRFCGRIDRDDQGNLSFKPELHDRALSRLTRISLLGITSVTTTSAVSAQSQTGSTIVESASCEVRIRTSDPAGAPIEKAQVRIAASLGLVRGSDPEATNSDGEFATRLYPGKYTFRMESPGFATLIMQDVDVSCDTPNPLVLNAVLRVEALMGEVVFVTPAYRIRSFFRHLLHLT